MTKQHLRIALCGKMKSGKDTLGLYLKKTYGGRIFHVAQGVYDATEMLLGYSLIGKRISMENKTKFERLALQWVGRWGRLLFGKDIWLKKALRKLESIEGNVYITGVRFPNEVKALRERGVKVVWIDRAEHLRVQAGAFNLDHETETALDEFDDFDAVFDNNTTREALFIRANDFVRGRRRAQ